MNNTELRPYMKVCLKNSHAICAIYEPHPFRKSAFPINTSVSDDIVVPDDEWCWVFYDWCGNPIGISYDMPEGEIVPIFTEENVWCKELADYLNKENAEFVDAWNRRHGTNFVPTE